MELSTQSQFFDTLGKAKNVLVVLPKEATADMVASGLALRLFLEKLEKEVEVVSAGALPKNISFLPGVAGIKQQLSHNKRFVIVVDTQKNKLEELSYQAQDGKVRVYLKSSPGLFTEQDVSFESESLSIDVAIILGAAALADLGELFEANADLFFQVPKINIDHKAGNEYYGAINLVDINATSVAEILTSLLESYESQLVDEDIATCLLTGIISQTNSFQRVQTTPKVFLQASRLMALGGRQQEVIKHLYKTRSLQFLRLWGRALARLRLIEEAGAMYSILLISDFQKSEADVESLPLVLRELMENVHGYRLVAVVGEKEHDEVRLVVAGHEQIAPEVFIKEFGTPTKQAAYGLVPYWVYEFEVKNTSVHGIETKLNEIIKIL